jgi:hypothetical protein
MILQNVWNHSCNDTASHPTRPECAKLLLRTSNLTAYTFILSEMKTFSNRTMKMKEKCFTESVGMDSQVSDTGAL